MEKITPEILQLELSDALGEKHKLADYQGKYLVLYFYPRDNTPGCTKEACSFRDANIDIKALGAEVVGISKDSGDSHKKFSEKYQLNFTLLADTDTKLNQAFGVWQKKKFLGHEFLGTVRTTFIIGPEQTILKRFDNVKPDGHAEEVLAVLKQLMGK
jgi:peroxiredoxin Q/BCP